MLCFKDCKQVTRELRESLLLLFVLLYHKRWIAKNGIELLYGGAQVSSSENLQVSMLVRYGYICLYFREQRECGL